MSKTLSRKLNTFFFFPFPPLFCSFLGNFGPLGESYDESEALGEPLDESASESLAESQDEPMVVEQPPALYGAPAPPPPVRA